MHYFVTARLSTEAKELFHQISQPYYAERLLEPVFVWGIGCGVILMLAAMCCRDARLKLVALVLLAAASFAVFPYLKTRQRAAGHAAERAVPAVEVTKLRQKTKWVFVTLGGLAVGTIVFGNRGRFGTILTIATLAGGLGAFGVGLWLDAQDAGAIGPPSSQYNGGAAYERTPKDPSPSP